MEKREVEKLKGCIHIDTVRVFEIAVGNEA